MCLAAHFVSVFCVVLRGRLLGGCSVWFVWSDERVNRSNSYSRQTTKINSHSASFFRLIRPSCESVSYITFNFSADNRSGPTDLVKYSLKIVN